MGETQEAQPGVEDNPFDPANHAQGGGLWDGKTVTITSAVAKVEPLFYGKNKEGGPVIDKETKEQSILTALFLTGISDDAVDKERNEEYSVGKLITVKDGAFVMKDGSPLKFHANSNLSKLTTGLKASGFDIGTLLVRDAAGAIVYVTPGTPKQDYSKLVGARFVFKAEVKLGKDGKSIKDKKGYDKSAHLPVKFLGYGPGAAGASKPGNGAVSGNGSALDAKADGAVLAALATAGGKLTRAELVRSLATGGLKGDPDANAIISKVVQDSFHAGKPWKFDPIEGASL